MKFSIVILLICMLSTWTATASPAQEAVEVIEGILVGAFGDIGHEVKTCIKDGEEIFKDIEEAVKDFEAGGRDNIIAGLIKIGEALQLLPEEVKDCEAIPDLIKDIEIIAAEFLNPEELIIHIGEEIIWHGVSIFKDVKDCVSQFKNGAYEPAGEDIGDIIKMLFLSAKLNDVVIDAEDFLEGFFKGALEDDSVEINDCITDATEVIEELEIIIADIKSGVTEDIEKLFLDFIDLITESVQSVAQCEKAPAELAVMLEWTEQMKDIATMEKKLFNGFLFYPDRLKEDFKNMIDSFEVQTFGTSGFCLGDVLHILFIDISTVNEDYLDDAVEFLTAFYGKAFKIDLDLSTCEADAEAEWALVKKAIDELETLSISSIKAGVEDLMKAIPAFVETFKECESDWPALERGLVEMSEFIHKPTQIPWAITKACTTHLFEVTTDCNQIYHAFHNSPHNFAKGGEGSGDLTGLLLSELNSALEESRLVEELK
jgi:hypothetical protein